jgi:hypothetical protein
MIRRSVHAARRGWDFWTNSDHSLAALLLFLLVYLFLLYPLYNREEGLETIGAVSFSVIVILGVMATTRHHLVRTVMVIIAAVAFLSHWTHFFLKGNADHLVSAGAAALFFGAQTVILLQRVFQGGSITIYRIYGAMAAYLLLGLLWAEIYMLLFVAVPGSFYFSPETLVGQPPSAEMFYLSFTTLTTLGLGDILPVHPMARSMVTLEALVGQLYPAVLLARLVTLYKN